MQYYPPFLTGKITLKNEDQISKIKSIQEKTKKKNKTKQNLKCKCLNWDTCIYVNTYVVHTKIIQYRKSSYSCPPKKYITEFTRIILYTRDLFLIYIAI